MLSNRRAFPRYFFTVAVSIFQGESIYRCSECRNISRGGLCVILNEFAIITGDVSVALTKMYNNSIINFEASCRVAWQDISGVYDNARMIGLEFVEVSDRNIQSLEQIITYSSRTMEFTV